MIAVLVAVSSWVATALWVGPSARPHGLPQLRRSLVSTALVAAAVGLLAASIILFVFVVVAGLIGGEILVRERQRRARRSAAALAPVALEVTAARLRAGAGLLGALQQLDGRQRDAVGLTRALTEVAAGRSLAEVTRDRRQRSTPGLVMAAVRILDRTGAPAAVVLERVADRLRAQNNGEALTRAESGQQLASAAVMAGLPVLTAIGLSLTSRRAAEFYLHTAGGGILLLASTGLSALSWFWMRALLTRDLPW